VIARSLQNRATAARLLVGWATAMAIWTALLWSARDLSGGPQWPDIGPWPARVVRVGILARGSAGAPTPVEIWSPALFSLPDPRGFHPAEAMPAAIGPPAEPPPLPPPYLGRAPRLSPWENPFLLPSRPFEMPPRACSMPPSEGALVVDGGPAPSSAPFPKLPRDAGGWIADAVVDVHTDGVPMRVWLDVPALEADLRAEMVRQLYLWRWAPQGMAFRVRLRLIPPSGTPERTQ